MYDYEKRAVLILHQYIFSLSVKSISMSAIKKTHSMLVTNRNPKEQSDIEQYFAAGYQYITVNKNVLNEYGITDFTPYQKHTIDVVKEHKGSLSIFTGKRLSLFFVKGQKINNVQHMLVHTV